MRQRHVLDVPGACGFASPSSESSLSRSAIRDPCWNLWEKKMMVGFIKQDFAPKILVLLTPMWRKTTINLEFELFWRLWKKVYINSWIHLSTSLGSRSRWDALAEKAPTRLGDRGDQVPCFIDSQLNQEQLSEFKALFLERFSIYQFPKRPQFFLKALSSVFWLVDGFGKSPVAPVGCLITNITYPWLVRPDGEILPTGHRWVGSGFVGQDGWKYQVYGLKGGIKVF